MRVFLTGVGCVGKSTIGEEVARLLEVRFYDLDEEIERFFGTSIERLQSRFLTVESFRNEAAKALSDLMNRPESRDSVVALSPSGLMGGYLRAVRKAVGIVIALHDKPENILQRITFYDVNSKLVEKVLTAEEKRLYLREIKKDITYFGKTYQRADAQVDISGLGVEEAARKVRETVEEIAGRKTEKEQSGRPNLSRNESLRELLLMEAEEEADWERRAGKDARGGEELSGRIVGWYRGRQFIVHTDDGCELRAILTARALYEAGEAEGQIEGARVKVKLYKHPKMHRITWLHIADPDTMGDSSPT